jgi:fatty-acyl-CoA synthase
MTTAVTREGLMAEWFQKTTLGALVDDAAHQFGPREALCFQGQRWSFAQFREDVDQAARGLIQLGIQPGEKVSLWMPNRPEWLHILYGAAKIGAVVVPVNTRFRTTELEYLVRQSDSSTLITVDRSGPVEYLEMVRQVCPEIQYCDPNNLHSENFPQLKRVLIVGDSPYPGTHCWANVIATADAVPMRELEQRQQRVNPDDTALIMYTSGTTGFPKGAMHNHNIIRTITDAANRMGITPRDVILIYLPLFHAFGFYEGALMFVHTGARMVLTTLFDAEEALRLIEQERVTVINGFDTHFYGLTTHLLCQTINRSTLRTGLLAVGMASSEMVARRAQKLLGPTVSGWGMTEVGCGAARSFLDSSEDDRCLGSGHALPGYEFKVIDPATGKTVPPDTMGELCVRGYAVTQGYYKKPEETAKTMDAEGWFHTGDVVTMRDDGQIRFLGRYKDLLKVGGENVDPIEVEAFLLNHPAISKAQVVGLPDQRLSEVACVCVVLKEGHQAAPEDIISFCRGKLAGFKIPRHVLFMDDYPMTASGKVQKFRLREMVIEALQLPA